MFTCAKLSPMFTRAEPDDPGERIAVADFVTNPKGIDNREALDEAFASGAEVTMTDGEAVVCGTIRQMSPDTLRQLPTGYVYARSLELVLTEPPKSANLV